MEFKFNGVGNAANDKIQGIGTFQGGVYGALSIDGVCTISGDIEAESLNINGVCTCTGNAAAKKFDCDGVLTIEGNLRAGEADVDGVVTVNGKKLEADKIKCDGVVTVLGEISADVIEAKGHINAEAIVGDRITIKSYWSKWFPKFLFKVGKKGEGEPGVAGVGIGGFKLSVVDLIEGTTVELRGVRAKSVNGHDVRIGKNCEIERVEATGELFIDPKARVGEVKGA